LCLDDVFLFFSFFLKSEIALKRRGRCDIFERRETI
jgi:hypothetical protein